MPNLAMRLPATQFSRDGLDLSWPLGGEREVVAVPEEKMTLGIRRRIAEGSIVIVDDAPTKSAEGDARVYRLLTGKEARDHFNEPAGPVTRVVYRPATPEDERDYQLEVQDAQTASDLFVEAQDAKAKAAEEAHAAISKRQAEAEKKAAAEAKKAVADDEPDILAERLRRTEEASAEWHAAHEAAFMERERARQKVENEELKHFDARQKETPTVVTVGNTVIEVSEPDTSDDDKKFMAAEKARQEQEAAVEKERQAKAKEDAKNAPKVAVNPQAGKTDPSVTVSSSGRKASVGVTPADKATAPAKGASKTGK